MKETTEEFHAEQFWIDSLEPKAKQVWYTKNETIYSILLQWKSSVGHQSCQHQQEVYDFLLMLEQVFFLEDCVGYKLLFVKHCKQLFNLCNADFETMDEPSHNIVVELAMKTLSLCRKYSVTKEDRAAKRAAEEFLKNHKFVAHKSCPHCGHFLTLKEVLKKFGNDMRLSHFTFCPHCGDFIQWPYHIIVFESVIELTLLGISIFKFPSTTWFFFLFVLFQRYFGDILINYNFLYIERKDPAYDGESYHSALKGKKLVTNKK